jgi:hypothetical protein
LCELPCFLELPTETPAHLGHAQRSALRLRLQHRPTLPVGGLAVLYELQLLLHADRGPIGMLELWHQSGEILLNQQLQGPGFGLLRVFLATSILEAKRHHLFEPLCAEGFQLLPHTAKGSRPMPVQAPPNNKQPYPLHGQVEAK